MPHGARSSPIALVKPSPQLLHNIPDCLCEVLVLRYTFVLFREYCFVEMPRKDWSVDIGLRPHRSDGAPGSAVLHRCHEVKSLVCNAFFGQLCGVTWGEECEFGRWELRPDNLKESEATIPVKLEQSMQWFLPSREYYGMRSEQAGGL